VLVLVLMTATDGFWANYNIVILFYSFIHISKSVGITVLALRYRFNFFTRGLIIVKIYCIDTPDNTVGDNFSHSATQKSEDLPSSHLGLQYPMIDRLPKSL